MKHPIPRLFALATLALSAPAYASVEANYDAAEPRATTPWYAPASEAARAADMDFITGMRPHHAGALSMSEAYLADPNASNATLKQLARGIIRNQTFEIGMLDSVESFVAPATAETGMRQVAEEGQVQRKLFIRSPIPTLLLDRSAVSARDVQMAKAMIVHHQAALDMCRDYLNREGADNGYLRGMCLDIQLDQQQEINLMNAVIARYPGDPASVKIDASMIHGMDHMLEQGYKGYQKGARNPHAHH